MNVAAIDIGTNSTRYMVVAQTAKGTQIIERGGEITRLGEGLQKTGRLNAQAQKRTLKTLEKAIRSLQKHAPEKIFIFATSAVREATNKKAFKAKVKRVTGYNLHILSGPKEAELAYHGITASLPQHKKNALILDIGGGSTELVFQQTQNQLRKISFKMGAVRLAEMIQKNPSKALIHAEEMIYKKLKPVNIKKKILIGAGGTLTTLAAIDLKLKTYQPNKIHGHSLSIQAIEHIGTTLDNLTLTQRKKIPGLPPKRADIILPGTLIVLLVLEALHLERIKISDRGILYGACLK